MWFELQGVSGAVVLPHGTGKVSCKYKTQLLILVTL